MMLNPLLQRKKEPSNFIEKNLKKRVLINMKFQIRKCQKCNIYSLREKCKNCNQETKSVHPAKYSPDDKYLRYRIRENFN